MAKAEVGIVFKAYDDVSKRLNSIGGGLDAFSRKLVTLGAGYIGVRGVVGATRKWVTEAKEAIQVQRTFDLVLGDSAAAAGRWAERYSFATGLSHTETRKLLIDQQMFGEELGLTRQQALQTAQALTRLADDTASFTRGAVSQSDVLQTYQTALGGSYRGLLNLGIKIDDLTVKQYALRQGWIKDGEELSRAQKAAATYNLILERTEKIQGDVARSAGTVEDAERRLKKEWADLHEQLGKDILPAYRTGVGLVHDFAKGLRAIVEEAEKVPAALKKAGQSLDEIGRAGVMGPLGGVGSTLRLGGPVQIDVGQPRHGLLTEGLPLTDTDIVPPDQMARWQAMWDQARKDNEEIRRRANFIPLPNPGGADADRKRREEEKYRDDVSAAYRRMYNDLDRRREESWVFQQQLLAAERTQYEQLHLDQNLLDKWYTEQWRELEIGRLEASQDFFDGFRAGTMRMQDDLMTLGQMGARSAEMMRDAWAEGSWDIITRARSASAVLRALLMDMARMMYTRQMNQFFNSGMNWLSNGWGSGGGLTPGPAVNAGANTANFEMGIGNANGAVIDEPISFWMHGRRQRGGEAGEEGLLPLARTSGGKLGVHVASRDGSTQTDALLRQLIGAVRDGQRIFVMDDRGEVKQELRQMQNTRSVLMR